MKRLAYSLLAFFGLLLGVALIVPLFIDVNQYKGEIIAKTKEATGRDLVIKGPIELSLLPSPAITLHQVTLANHPQAHKPYLITFEKASIKAAILPLLQKKIHITKVNLKNAKIALEKLSNGQMNWEFSTPETSLHENPSLLSTPQDGSSKSSFDLGIDKISIEDAYVTYQEGQKETVIKDLSCDASLQSLKGPYAAEGQFELQQQTLKFDLKAGALTDAQPIEAEVRMADSRLKIVGVYTSPSQTFKGNLESQIESKFLQKLTNNKELPKFAKNEIDVKALLVANPSQVQVNNIKLKLGEVTTTGQVIATLDNIPQIKGRFTDLPGQSRLDFTFIQNPSELQGQVQTNSQRLQDLLGWLGIDVKNIPSHLVGKCLLSTRYSFLKDTVYLRDILLTLQDAQLQGEIAYKLNQKVPSIRVDLQTSKVENFMPRSDTPANKPLGSGRLRGSLQGDAQKLIFDVQTMLGTLTLALKGQADNLDKKPTLAIDVDGQTTNLGAFLVDLGFVSKSTYRNASLKGHIAGDLENLRLNTQANLDGLSLTTSGMVQKLMTIPAFDLKLHATHPNIRNFLKLADHTSTISSGAFVIAAHLVGDKTTFKLEDMKASIGHSFDLKGNLDVKRTNDKTKVLGTLTATSLNLDLLLALAEEKQQLPTEPQFLLVALKPTPVPHSWSQEPLNFTLLKDLEADVKFIVHKIKRKDILITDLKASTTIQNGILEAPLTATIYGGKVQGNLRITADQKITLGIDLKEADLASLVPYHSGQIKLVGGKLSFNTALTTHGKSAYQLVGNLSGPIKLSARNGVINGFDLQAISQRLKQVASVQGLLGLLSNFMTKGQTTFKSFDGDILFKNGVGTIQSMQLIADGGTGQATGLINLPSYLLNIASEFHLTDHPKLPPFKMYLTGPLDNPQRNLETQALQNYLIQNVFKGVVDQLSKGKVKVGDVLGGILGQEQGTNPSPSDQEQSAQKPEKVVKDLLKKLF